MMNGRQQDFLRLQPHMVPAVRVAVADALNQLNDTLSGLRRDGSISEPWLGDQISNEVAVYYRQRAMDGSGSSYEALAAYRDELGRVHDTLHQMEADYLRTENRTADTFRLQT